MVESILDFCHIMMDYFLGLFDLIKPLWQLKIGDLVPIGLRSLTDPILETMGIADFSFMAFIFGTGITIYLGYMIVTWLLNLVT